MLIPSSEMQGVGDAECFFVADELLGETTKFGKMPNRVSSSSLDTGAETSKCGICSTSVLNRGVLDCCTHWFCFSCIDDWATVTNLCPLCKARFRFITCLPVRNGDHSSWEDPDNIGAGFAKRVDGSNDDESSLPFSFPSYFIDEEAVVCMDGDACRVRAGLLSPEVEGILAADTSVACDLCDCWYHAGCVNFDPEQSSFYCPRCIALQEKAGSSLHAVQSWTPISAEARATSLVGSLPAENELSYGGRSLLGSTSVAIAVAEEGESAVSLSVRHIPVQAGARPSPVSAPEDSREMWSPIRETLNRSESYSTMWSPIREDVNRSQSYNTMWSPIREPVNASQEYELWSPTPGPVNEDENDVELWSPTPGPVNEDENDVELWSPTPQSERASVSSFKEQPVVASMVSAKSWDPMSSMAKNDNDHEVLAASVADAARHHLSKRSATVNGFDFVGEEPESSSQVTPAAKRCKRTEVVTSSVGTTEDKGAFVNTGCLQVAAEQATKGNRKPLQEDERRIDSSDLPEPPRKVARKSTKKNDASEGRKLALGKDSCNKILVDQNLHEKTDDCESNVLSSVNNSKDTCKGVSVEETNPEQTDDHQGQGRVSMEQNTPVVESKSHVDVMDIVSDLDNHLVKDTAERSNTQKGVRTRIIMHREADVKDKVGASIVERVRQQMRETAGYVGGEELGKVEVSDDRFIAAFKAALTRSKEKSKETTLTGSRPRKSGWLSKVMNQSNAAKGSRESLTRKLYGGGTGRWDRDWDIAFWKERSGQLRTARKEAEDEIESLGRAGKRGGDKKQPDPEDSIFSRLYVADTSLLPRNDDVQPLSVQVKNLAEGSSRSTSKLVIPVSKVAELACGISASSKGGSGRGKCLTTAGTTKATVDSKRMEGLSPRLSAKSGSVQSQESTLSKTSLNEVSNLKSDAKKDKRQWALDVLARKTGISANASGSASTVGALTNREGQFSLLLQLPVDMRPLLTHNRRSKVPTAVRQVQLNRIVEQELKRANIAVIQKSPDCEDVVNRAKAREEEIYKKSNSKGVYVNLCVRSLAQTETAAKVKQDTQMDVSDAVQKALEATGLVDSPPASPCHGHSPVSTGSEAKVPSKDSSCKLNHSTEDKWVENVLEMGNLDIYGDFEFNPDDELGDAFGLENLSRLKLEAATGVQDQDNRTNKMIVVLTAASNTGSKPGKVLPGTVLEAQLLKEKKEENAGTMVDPLPASQAPLSDKGSCEEHDDDLYSGLEVKLTTVPTGTNTAVTARHNAVDLEPFSLLPQKEEQHVSPTCHDLKSNGSASEGHEKNVQTLTSGEGSQSPSQAAKYTMDDWMNTEKFADLDRRIENIRQNTSPSVNREIDVPWISKRANVELPRQSDSHNSHHSVHKQVEIYVNQHLKPLYRSGVINADQFRYAVSKTATKVMEHHENAMTAEFLITEGSKVRKLADQYLQAYAKRKVQ